MFRKRNSVSDNSRGTSMQSIVNNIENNSEDNRSVATDNDRHSMHSNWNEFINEEAKYSKLKNEINVDASASNASIGEAVHTTNGPTKKEGSEKYCLGAIQAQVNRMGELENKVTLCN